MWPRQKERDMPEEATTAPDMESWLTAHGYPPIRGADDGTVPASEGTPTGPAEPTPQEPAPEAAPDGGDVDWEKRYNDMRPEFDRRGTQLQEAEPAAQLYQALQNPESRDDVFRYLAQNFGYDLQEMEDAAAAEDQEQQLQDPRVDELASQFEQDRFERYLTDLESHIDSEVDRLANDASVKLTDDERNLIFATVEIQDDGSPKVEDAFKRISGLRDLHIKEYRDSKKDAPPPPTKGSSGEPQAQPQDARARRAKALDIANAAFAQS